MRIVLCGLNYAPEPIGTARYTTGLAEFLAARGHSVRVIAGQPYYPQWRTWEGYAGWTRERRENLDIWRVPHFIPRHPTGVGRLLQHLSFALAALPTLLWTALYWRPERVIAIAPCLVAAPAALLAARLSGAQAWLHLQDFEVEAAQATGHVSRHPTLARLLLGIERMVLRGFDRLSSISPAMCRRLAEKGIEPCRISEQRNWADLGAVTSLDRPSAYREKWKIRTPHVALYSGAMGRKQGLELVVETARRLAHRQDLTFVLCGNGPYRAELEAMAAGLENIRFFDLQRAEELGELLALASVHILPQIEGAADLVLPSKLPNMLASGHPIVATAHAGTGLFDEVSGCGLTVEPGNVAALASAVAELCDNPELAQKFGLAARRRAETRWHGPTILAGFSSAIEGAAPSTASSPAYVGEPG
jgi:colanic acid biosynthesis glycosyl transferase WcaI